MAGPNVSLNEVLEAFGRRFAARIHTGIPAEVVSFDPAQNVIAAKVMVKTSRFDAEGNRSFDDVPIIPDVPVHWPRGGGFVLTLPLQPGDFVWLMFSEAGLSKWRNNGKQSEPRDSRRHSWGHPYALPGAFPDCEPLATSDVAERTSSMVVGEDGGDAQLVIDKGPTRAIKLGKSATDFVALATPTNAAIVACMNAVSSLRADVASLVTALASHTHPGVTTGPGVSGAPVPGTFPAPGAAPSNPGSVAATLTKAK